MPELPEAEIIVRGLRPALDGAVIARARVLRPDILRTSPARFRKQVAGRRVLQVGRRGKNIVIELNPQGFLVVNLGMTGRLLTLPSASPSTHPAVRFSLDDGGVLVYDDVRRFGAVEILTPCEWEARSAAMGPEPLDARFTGPDMFARLQTSRSPVRSWLLDQRRVAGVGNIYANEALWRARVHPARPADTLTRKEGHALLQAVRLVLLSAIEHGGTTLRNYRNASGERGNNARRLGVYGRVGEPCIRCGTGIERLVFGSRSAFLCPRCQPWEKRRT
ncbi:MAG: bifunctional DNA-formamidopyrimidine glycosylase/DNA-(apurinic or apyrimidinic site) lyase [Gemmatimonadota bacterium]|nr:MAG: bifunctional DNA-formamidopyrimidine glycosylase/DNA-(apurinic or apyrimidinic site) lyase [Gemmatimonadota bacterium]